MNDTEILVRLRSSTGVTSEALLRSALDVAGRGLGARLPNDVVRDMAHELPPMLAEPLAAGSGTSPAHPNVVYDELSRRTGAPLEQALALVQTVFALMSEAANPQTMARARATLPPQWSDLLWPLGTEPRIHSDI